MIHVILLVLVLPLLAALLQNFLAAYFVIEGEPHVTPDEVTTFDVLAGVGIVMTLAPAIWGFVRGRWVFGILHLVTLGIVLLAAVVLAVPHADLHPPAKQHHLPSNYTPCYSGSGSCPGG